MPPKINPGWSNITLWVAMGICTHHWVSIVGVIGKRRRSATMAIDAHRSTICNWSGHYSIVGVRPVVYCGCGWLLMDTSACLLLAAIATGRQPFYNIVQTMYIAVASPTSIVQDENHLWTTMTSQCDKQCLSRGCFPDIYFSG